VSSPGHLHQLGRLDQGRGERPRKLKGTDPDSYNGERLMLEQRLRQSRERHQSCPNWCGSGAKWRCVLSHQDFLSMGSSHQVAVQLNAINIPSVLSCRLPRPSRLPTPPNPPPIAPGALASLSLPSAAPPTPPFAPATGPFAPPPAPAAAPPAPPIAPIVPILPLPNAFSPWL